MRIFEFEHIRSGSFTASPMLPARERESDRCAASRGRVNMGRRRAS